MRDIKGFCKLFDISIPKYDCFDYYITQLSKLNRYKNIREQIRLYEEAESKHEDLYEYRMRVSNEIINFISETEAYNEFMLDNFIKDYAVDKTLFFEDDKFYLSIDMNSANFQALKRYDAPFRNELCSSYNELLDKFSMPEVFKHSKSLRQFIFGNLNPKKQVKVQRMIIQELIDSIAHLLTSSMFIKYTRNDELIIEFDFFGELCSLIDLLDKEKFKYKIFTTKRHGDFRIDSLYDLDGNVLYKDMIGVDGTQYYQHIKQFVTNESLDIKDLYFKHKDKLCVWVEEGVNVNLK